MKLFKQRTRSPIVVGLYIPSHWFLNLIVHPVDLPLIPFGDYRVGFDLWKHVAITLIIEFAIFFIGTYNYVILTKAKICRYNTL